jgi:TP901 family phage tail tape measure protein
MPLGAREILVAIRARDVTSRVLGEIGTNFGKLSRSADDLASRTFRAGASLTGLGVGIGAVGVAGIAFFNDSIDRFIEYNKAAALTRTQVDDLSVSVKDLGEIGKRVASVIPVPLEQMQDALYDIFSSMEVNVKEAEILLTAFSKGAVAGQTDIRTAARSTISILNAYGLEATDVNRVMDIMFQLVRKGVGTYEEFNSSIGRAIPAARAAGQSIETMAGMMGFLTRQGLSTQMAATSAARAMELFAKPDVVKALEGIGVQVKDSRGNFLQLNDIVTQLAENKGWAEMAAPDRKKLFQDIFGQGSIQARRFFDLAIPNYRELNDMTGFMINSAGALGGAYDTMFEEPAMKAQLLKNKIEVLRLEIGEQLLPAKLRLMEAAMKLLNWWTELDGSTKKIIVAFAAFSATMATITGVVLTFVGAMLMILSVLAPMVGGFAAAMGLISGFGVALAGLVVIGALLVANWDKIKDRLEIVFAAIAAGLGIVAAGVHALVGVMGTGFLSAMLAAIGTAAAVVAGLLAIAAVVILVIKNWDTLVQWSKNVANAFMDLYRWFMDLSIAAKILIGIVAALISPWILVAAAVVVLIKNFGKVIEFAKGVWTWFNNLHGTGQVLIGVLVAMISPFMAIIAVAIAVYKHWGTLVEWGGKLVEVGKNLFDLFMGLATPFKVVAGVILGLIAPIVVIIGAVVALGVAIYKNWNTIRDATIDAWSAVVNAVNSAWEWLKNFWNWLTNIDVDVWGGITDAAVTAWNTIKDVARGAVNVISSVFDSISGAVSSAASAIARAWEPVQSGFQTAFDWFMDQFGDGFVEMWNTLTKEVSNIINELGETASALARYFEIGFGKVQTATGAVWKALQFMWDRVKPILETFGKIAIANFTRIVGFMTAHVMPVFNVLSTAFVNSFDVIMSALKILWTYFQFVWDVVVNVVTMSIKIVASVIKSVVPVVLAVWNNFGKFLWQPIKAAWDLIVATFNSAVTVISNIVQLFLNIIQMDWDEAWENIKNILGGVWDFIVAAAKFGLTALKQLFMDLPGAIIGLIGDLGPILFDLGKNILQALIDGAKSLWGALGTFFGDVGPLILELFANAGTWLFEVGKSILQGLWDGIQSIWDTITTFATDLFDAIVGGVKEFFGISSPSSVMMDLGKDILQGLWDGIKSVFASLVSWLVEIPTALIDFFADAGTWLLDAGKAILRGLWDGIVWVWNNAIQGWMVLRKTAFVDFFAGAVEWLVEAGKNVLKGIKTGIVWLWENSIFGWMFERKQRFIDFFAGAGQWLVEAGKNVFRGIKTGIVWLWDNSIFGYMKEMPTKFKNFFSSAKDWLVQAGRWIIGGLKNGILEIVRNIRDWISDRVDFIVNAFKDFFGIESPSTVMMEVGKNFIRGFMNGVVLGARNIPKLISKIGMGVIDLLKYLGEDISGFFGGIFGSTFSGGGNTGVMNLAQQMASMYGWVGAQWDALKALVQGESSWNPNAQNPTSTAYGLFQFLNSTWATVGAKKTSDPAGQISAGLEYIRQRYGTPIAAYSAWLSRSPHWYEKGAWNVPYTGLAGLHQGEMVLPADIASMVRRGSTQPRTATSYGAQFVFNGNVTFGSDRVPEDLDWFTRTRLSGVGGLS